MTTLVIAEHNNQQLAAATRHILTAGQLLGAPMTVLVAGEGCAHIADEAASYSGVTHVLLAEHAAYADALAENISQLILQYAVSYTHIMAPATTFGKQLMPRVAALLDVEQVSDVTAIIDANTFVHPIYAGNALETVRDDARVKILTIRPTAFVAASIKENAAPITVVTDIYADSRIRFIGMQATESTRPLLSNARVVISGGRALKNAENFKLLESLADHLGAAIGASRAAVDAGFVPNDYQVGQTGKIVAPDLYIAIGISGAIQHVAGMKDSKVIVAINKDPDAPIFQIADYGLVGDLFSVLPELEAEIKKS